MASSKMGFCIGIIPTNPVIVLNVPCQCHFLMSVIVPKSCSLNTEKNFNDGYKKILCDVLVILIMFFKSSMCSEKNMAQEHPSNNQLSSVPSHWKTSLIVSFCAQESRNKCFKRSNQFPFLKGFRLPEIFIKLCHCLTG